MLDLSSTHRAFGPNAHEFSAEASGLLLGKLIATTLGWRPVEALCVGDLVLTFDNGFLPIRAVRRVVLWDGDGACPDHLRPVEIGADLLPDVSCVRVMSHQGIMVESDFAESHRGDPFAVILPGAIAQFGLAQPVHCEAPIEVIILEFDSDEVIYGQSGMLYHVPAAAGIGGPVDTACVYKILNEVETRTVLQELHSANTTN
ncbi:MAG: Hint domain-containing protein [Pseudomonadota bacterium]